MNRKTAVHYDEAADVLYISFGKPVPAVGLDIAPNFVLRIDPSSGIDARKVIFKRIMHRTERKER